MKQSAKVIELLYHFEAIEDLLVSLDEMSETNAEYDKLESIKEETEKHSAYFHGKLKEIEKKKMKKYLESIK